MHPPTKNPRLIRRRLIMSKQSWSSFMVENSSKEIAFFLKLQKIKNNSSVIFLPVSCNPRACEGATDTHSAIMAWFQQCHSSWVVNVNLILLLYSCDFETVCKTQNMSPTIHTSSWMCTFMSSVGREKPFFFICVHCIGARSHFWAPRRSCCVCLCDFFFFFFFFKAPGLKESWSKSGRSSHLSHTSPSPLSPSTPSHLPLSSPPPVSSFNHSLHPLLHLLSHRCLRLSAALIRWAGDDGCIWGLRGRWSRICLTCSSKDTVSSSASSNGALRSQRRGGRWCNVHVGECVCVCVRDSFREALASSCRCAWGWY